MPLDPGIVEPLGVLMAKEDLQIPKALAFAFFLEEVGPQAFSKLIEVRRQSEPSCEVVIFEVEVERPQKLAYPIHRVELLAAVFKPEDIDYPEVLALRADFPSAPHIFLTEVELPRRLCLYEQPFENEKLNWTPARFLKRVRYWLAKTATGTLHAEDQPLEPLMIGTRERLILPPDFSIQEIQNKPGLLDIYGVNAVAGEDLTLVAFWQEDKTSAQAYAVAAVFVSSPKTHGVMRHQPANYKELEEFCISAGLDLTKELSIKIKEWHVQKPMPKILKSQLVIILLLPKTRVDGGVVETVEEWAFLTFKSVEEVGIALDVIQKSGGVSGHILGNPSVDQEKLKGIPIGPLQVMHSLSPALAAAMNGVEACETKILAIGMGALGSQIFNNLARSGFGRWTLVDSDTFLPHNGARHVLGDWAVGHFKVQSMALMTNALFGDSSFAKPVPADVLKPGKLEEAVTDAFKQSELILDFSASVAVSRHLAIEDNKAKAISAFLTPLGNSLVIVTEDMSRKCRLDWLEMLHYRAVLNEPTLKGSLLSRDARFRYGNSCRDVSSRLAQDDAAIWGGVASKALRQLAKDEAASVCIYFSRPDGQITIFKPQIFELIVVEYFGWRIQLDVWILEKLERYRKAKLPNETGGILVGNYDTHRKVCSIVDVVPSPKDSGEWPTSYIRGSTGLLSFVKEVEENTQGQIGYVGEWHSHPDGYSVDPSNDDIKAYGWLAGLMQLEGLPAVMLITGENRRFCLVSDN